MPDDIEELKQKLEEAKQEELEELAKMTTSKGLVMQEFELPLGVYDGIKFYPRIILREMTGEEEDILVSRLSFSQKINMILERTIVKFLARDNNELKPTPEIIRRMSVNDRLSAFLFLRIVSLGNEFSFITICPFCGSKLNVNVDLYTLDIVKVKDEDKALEYKVQLPSGRVALCQVPLASLEDRINVKDLTSAIALRVIQLDGQPVTIEDLKKLSMKDRAFLRQQFEKHEGGIDTTIEIECNKCGNEFKTDIDFGQKSFFSLST